MLYCFYWKLGKVRSSLSLRLPGCTQPKGSPAHVHREQHTITVTIIAKSVTVKNEKKPQSLFFWKDGHVHSMEYFREVKSECVTMDPF